MARSTSNKEKANRQVSPPLTGSVAKATRGRKPRHTTTEMARIAVGIADTEGIEAVSMRRIASAMKSGTASLYRYVSKKDELLDLMVDYVRGNEPFPRVAGTWRSKLRQVAHSTRALVLRHPWMTKVSPVRTSLGLNSIRWWEFRLKILDGLGLDIDEMIVVINALDNFAKGYAAAETAELEQSRSSGIEHKRWLDDNAQYVMSVVASGEFPLFNRIVRDAKAPHDPKRHDREFALSVEHILNGFAFYISQKPPISASKSGSPPKGSGRGKVHKKEIRKS